MVGGCCCRVVVVGYQDRKGHVSRLVNVTTGQGISKR